jgi:hypothetical protein
VPGGPRRVGIRWTRLRRFRQSTTPVSGRAARLTEAGTAAGIYGVIVSASVMATAHGGSVPALTVTVLVTLAVYWAAERYSALVAERIHLGRRPSAREVWTRLTAGWEIVSTSALPLLVVVALTSLGVGLDTALAWALACSTALLCLAGWEIGRDGRLSVPERLVSSATAGGFGVLLTILKTMVH